MGVVKNQLKRESRSGEVKSTKNRKVMARNVARRPWSTGSDGEIQDETDKKGVNHGQK